MHGHRIGYVRVSSFDPNPERQLEHVPADQFFTDNASDHSWRLNKQVEQGEFRPSSTSQRFSGGKGIRIGPEGPPSRPERRCRILH